jgi:hypothetical protein
MEFTGPDGRAWLAYVEATPPVRRWRLISQTVMPGRRVRFDSAGESRVSATVPAGSPFLPERRLQALLLESNALQPTPSGDAAPATFRQQRRELFHAGVRAWTRLRQGATRAGRTALRQVISGYRVHVGRGAMSHHRS